MEVERLHGFMLTVVIYCHYNDICWVLTQQSFKCLDKTVSFETGSLLKHLVFVAYRPFHTMPPKDPIVLFCNASKPSFPIMPAVYTYCSLIEIQK